MKSIIISILALAAIACDGGSTDTTEPGVAVAELSKWGLAECPEGLEQVGDYCVAGTVDMQLDIDDCAAVAHCLPGAHSCARAAVGGYLDSRLFTEQSQVLWPRGEVSAPWVTYADYQGLRESGIDRLAELGWAPTFDEDGTSECLIDAEADVVQDSWKWSKARARFK